MLRDEVTLPAMFFIVITVMRTSNTFAAVYAKQSSHPAPVYKMEAAWHDLCSITLYPHPHLDPNRAVSREDKLLTY